jgi:FtsZ-interacting cell division protein ZipA
MERTMNTGTVIVIIGAIVVIAIIVAIAYSQKNETRKLRSTFGPEYDRVVGQENGNTARAERVLRKRMKRIRDLDIRKPSPEASSRFAAQWRGIQELFVEDPRGAILLADSLVGEAITARGYPAADFEQRASDLSVKHSQLVADYRIAHDVAMHSQNGASTEDLRKAMQHYRDCLESILEIHIPKREEVHQ